MNIKDLLKVSKIRALKFSPVDMEQVESGGGIYRMYDANKQVIYVGKSNNLHRRLLQHIGKDTNTAYFIDEVKKIEWLKANDPVIQTLLEGIFIAYHAPKYNDEVKDRLKLQE
jgi:excinuclease UvrABC nuclease subunit